jgi:dihydroxyacetone kinase
VEAMRGALEGGGGLTEVLDRGTAAAEAGAEATKAMSARKGRASYIGERSVGHPDPGAVAAAMMLRAAADAWRS